MPLPEKVQAFTDITVPNNERQLRSFIGVINYYKGMWNYIADISAPLLL